MGFPTSKQQVARRAMSAKKKTSKSSGVKIGTAIKLTRKNGKVKTRVRGGSAQQRKNERQQSRPGYN